MWETGVQVPSQICSIPECFLHFVQGCGLSPVWVLQFPAQLNEFLHNCPPYFFPSLLSEHLSSQTVCLRWCVTTLVAFVLTFLHCVFTNDISNCSPERIYIHTHYILSEYSPLCIFVFKWLEDKLSHWLHLSNFSDMRNLLYNIYTFSRNEAFTQHELSCASSSCFHKKTF